MLNNDLIKYYETENSSPVMESSSGLINPGYFQIVPDHEIKRPQHYGN